MDILQKQAHERDYRSTSGFTSVYGMLEKSQELGALPSPKVLVFATAAGSRALGEEQLRGPQGGVTVARELQRPAEGGHCPHSPGG